MEIYVVQEGDNVYSISNRFGISVDRLAINNGLEHPFELTIGQALVIAYPTQIHIVREGDTLQSIADMYLVSIMKILRNNPYLTEREYIYPGETIVISYDTVKSIATNGFTYPYIKRDTLIKNLPNLTYLSVFNYTVVDKGEVIEYHEDSEIIQICIEYGVIPLLMLTSLTPIGDPNVEIAYNLLLSDEYQDNLVSQIINIIKNKGYYGCNMVFNYLNTNSQILYQNMVKKISNQLRQEGYLFFITINYNIKKQDDQILIDQVDYTAFSSYVDSIIFLKFFWSTNYDPPSPVSDINNISALVNYVVTKVPVDKIMIGKPLLGYDWPLPYIPNRSSAISISLNAVIHLAYDTGSIIQLDEPSQTPFFYYNQQSIGAPQQHIVWFVDARSMNALNDLINEYSLYGTGIWNIMLYNPQLWTILNSQYEIIKLM
jgi:spore germination protein